MMEIPLTQGRVALVDDEDYPTLSQFKWHFHAGYYAARSVYTNGVGRRVYMHNQVMNTDSWTDHIDRDGLNNRKENLRIASRSLQGHNRLMPKRILPRGVSFHKGKYQASIRYKLKLYYLGRYNTPEEAHAVYLNKAFELHGEYPPE